MTDLMELPIDEARLVVQQEKLECEQNYLDWMIGSNRLDAEFVEYCYAKAKQSLADYNLLEHEKLMTEAEEWSELAKGTKDGRFSIGEVREQRKRVAWEINRLNSLNKTSDEHSKSSETSGQ